MDLLSGMQCAAYRWARCILSFIALCLVVPAALGGDADCTRIAITTETTPVYDRTPTFYSGSGWKLGRLMTRLERDTEVRVCEEISVGLFFDKKTWLGIEFGDQPRKGWIYADQVKIERARTGRATTGFMLVASSVRSAAGSGTGAGAGIPGVGKWAMILLALLFVLLGMLSKVVYDEVDTSSALSLRTCLNPGKCIKALIAAPLSFSAFLEVGNFSFPNEAAVVIFFCMAFQNGFFWQTLLPPGKGVARIAPAT